jgi:hypothetical protein
MNHRNVLEAEALRTLIQRMRERVNHESNYPMWGSGQESGGEDRHPGSPRGEKGVAS